MRQIRHTPTTNLATGLSLVTPNWGCNCNQLSNEPKAGDATTGAAIAINLATDQRLVTPKWVCNCNRLRNGPKAGNATTGTAVAIISATDQRLVTAKRGLQLQST